MNEIALFSRVRKRMESLPIRMQLFIPFTTVFALSLAIIGCLVYYLVSCSLEETLTSELNKTTTSVIDSVQVAIRTSSKNYLRSFSIMLRERLNNHGTKNEKELIDIIARQRIGQSGFILVFNAKDKVPDAYLSTLQTAKTSGIDIDLILQKMKAFNEEGYIEIPKGESSGMARDVGVYFFKFKSLNWRLAIISVRSELIQLVDLSDFRDSVISLRFAKTGYAFIYNSKCEILAHPWIKPGKILDSTSPVMRKALVRMCDERNGFQKYSWKNPAENGFSEKLAIYKYIPEYDWIIGASISTNEIYEPIKRLSLLFVAICIVSLFIIFYISFQIASSFDKRLSQAESMRRENAKLSAAAKTTQMLAHDVRKPFAILQMILDKLQGIRTISELQDILKKFTPEAKKAIASVNGMINDVMEMGRTSPPNKEPASLLQVINNSLEEICRINLDSLVSFRYELKHKHMLFVDTLKIERVFSNILGNAFQAMRGRGEILFQSEETHNKMLLTIKNYGSYIAPEDIDRIFEAFYTKNKKSGTGLGLAIAKKIIEDHGGKIWCESSQLHQIVEFHFLLPIAEKCPDEARIYLPPSSSFIGANYKTSAARSENSDPSISDKSVVHLESLLIAYQKRLARKLRIAMIDDELLYLNYVCDTLAQSSKLSAVVDIDVYQGPGLFFAKTAHIKYDFLICDVDLGQGSINGFEIVEKLRATGSSIPVCIHSNRSLQEDYTKAVQVGAQALLPKPLTLSHLLKFMSDSIPQQDFLDLSASKPNIVLVEDETFYQNIIGEGLNDAHVSIFPNGEALVQVLEKDPTFVDKIDAFILDNHFAKSNLTGIEIASILRRQFHIETPLILMSNSIFATEDTIDFSLVLSKTPISWTKISDQLKQCRKTKPSEKSHQLPATENESDARAHHDIRSALFGIELYLQNLELNVTSTPTDKYRMNVITKLHGVRSHFSPQLVSEVLEILARPASDISIKTDLKAVLEKLRSDYEAGFSHMRKHETSFSTPPARTETHENTPVKLQTLVFLRDKEFERQVIRLINGQTTLRTTTNPDELASCILVYSDDDELNFKRASLKRLPVPVDYSSSPQEVVSLIEKKFRIAKMIFQSDTKVNDCSL